MKGTPRTGITAFVFGLSHRLTKWGQALCPALEPTFISKRFVKRAGQLIAVAMLALTLGIGLDIDVITRLITHNQAAATIIALACGAVFAGLWFVYPRLARDSK